MINRSSKGILQSGYLRSHQPFFQLESASARGHHRSEDFPTFSMVDYRSSSQIRPSKCTWWCIPLSKWVITPVISGLTPLIPFITRVVTHLLSGMSHQVQVKILKPRLWGTHSFFEQHPQRNINSCATVDWWSSPHVVVCHPTFDTYLAISQMLPKCDIFTDIYPENDPSVGKYY